MFQNKWFQAGVVALVAILALVSTIGAEEITVTFTPAIGPEQDFEESYTYPNLPRYENIDRSGQMYSSWGLGSDVDLKKGRWNGSLSFRRHKLQLGESFVIDHGVRQVLSDAMSGYDGRAYTLNADVQYAVRPWLFAGGGGSWYEKTNETFYTDHGYELRHRYYGPHASAMVRHGIGRFTLQAEGSFTPRRSVQSRFAYPAGTEKSSNSGSAFKVQAMAQCRITRSIAVKGGYRYEGINIPDWDSRTVDGTVDKLRRSLRMRGPWLGIAFQL